MKVNTENVLRASLFVVTYTASKVLELLNLSGPALEIIEIDPNSVRKATKTTRSKWVLIPRVRGGDWDEDVESWDEYAGIVYQSIERRFVDGCAWEDTEYYARAIEGINRDDTLYANRFQSENAVRTHFEKLDDMHEQIENGEYLRVIEILEDDRDKYRLKKRFYGVLLKFDEVTINFNRHGEPLFKDGTHRLSLAKVSSIDRIPVRVHIRHRSWDRTRNVILDRLRSEGNLHSIGHPDIPEFEPVLHINDIMCALKEEVEGEALIELTNYIYPIFSIEYDSTDTYSVPTAEIYEGINEVFEENGLYDFTQHTHIRDIPKVDSTLILSSPSRLQADKVTEITEHSNVDKIIVVRPKGAARERIVPPVFELDREIVGEAASGDVYRNGSREPMTSS